MKEQLISLAKEKGFKSEISSTRLFNPLSENEKHKEYKDLVYYLWMCEFQKWLREKHRIHLTVIHRNQFATVSNGKNTECFDYLLEGTEVVYRHFDTWDQALEKGLPEALKLVKKDEIINSKEDAEYSSMK